MEYISTSTLASKLKLPRKDLFDKLGTLGWIKYVNNKWILTEFGKNNGGQIKTSDKFGDYIVWPEGISLEDIEKRDGEKFLNATTIGNNFGVNSQRLNLILSELGWLEKEIAGWKLTRLGMTVGGKQLEHGTTGNFYVTWPESILQNKSLKEVFNQTSPEKEVQKNATPAGQVPTSFQGQQSFRGKFEAKHRTKDGHLVRSRAEVIIDDTLYDYGLVHAYEKKVPIEEELYTDFYLPNGKVYIEFWGLENDPKYAERKKTKQDIYKKYDLKLIELDDSDVANLDDHLPKKLLKFGIKVY